PVFGERRLRRAGRVIDHRNRFPTRSSAQGFRPQSSSGAGAQPLSMRGKGGSVLAAMTLRRVFLVLLIAIAAACAAPAPPPVQPPPSAPPSLEGYWRGQFQRGGATLPVELEFTRADGVLNGRFSSPDLRALGIPLREVRQEGASTHFVLTGDSSTA